jgi:hypothetical protein
MQPVRHLLAESKERREPSGRDASTGRCRHRPTRHQTACFVPLLGLPMKKASNAGSAIEAVFAEVFRPVVSQTI